MQPWAGPLFPGGGPGKFGLRAWAWLSWRCAVGLNRDLLMTFSPHVSRSDFSAAAQTLFCHKKRVLLLKGNDQRNWNDEDVAVIDHD